MSTPRRTSGLASPAAALALLLTLAGFTAFGAWAPDDSGWAVFATWPFQSAVALLSAGLLLSLWRRRRALLHAATVGGWLFHAGALLLAGAAAWHAAGFRAAPLELIEGQTVPLPDGRHALRLDRVLPSSHTGPWRKGDAAMVAVVEDGRFARPALVRMNEPLRVGSIWLHLGLHGYAPWLRVTPLRSGGPDPAAFVSLETALRPVVRYWRRFAPLPGTDLAATAVFRPAPRGPYPLDPHLTLVLGGAAARVIVLAPGGSVAAAGYRFELGEIRRWSRFTVSREPGLEAVFASFALMIAGAALAVAGGWNRVRG